MTFFKIDCKCRTVSRQKAHSPANITNGKNVRAASKKVKGTTITRVFLNNCLIRVPVQYIIGEWDFRELTLKMRPPVFVPRPETEMLVDLILKVVDSRNIKHVVELCCGSGAICLSLLYERSKVSTKYIPT